VTTNLEARVANLEARIRTLEGGRPGRKAKPIVVSKLGVCGIDPERDSETCPDASLYRKQRGCKGTACIKKTDEYYTEYRKGGK
jgi:hypothetical protein